MSQQVQFIMLNLQTISFKTTRVNLWLPTVLALLKEFPLSSQEKQENGSSIKLIIWSPLKLEETTLISSVLSVPQDQTNTLRLVLKTWWEKILNIDGELSIATLVNKSQTFMMKATTVTDQPPSSITLRILQDKEEMEILTGDSIN